MIAYFCAEFALEPDIPIYAGGLGILASDYLRQAAEQQFPIVGVGLFYDFNNSVHLTQAKDAAGKPILITVPIQDKQIKAQIFVYQLGSVPIYLLNTNLPENDPADRLITNKVYVADKETRLKQEIVLGIGGLRALEALNIAPDRYHLNEGHSAFLTLGLIHHAMAQHDLSFTKAQEEIKKIIVFTNHTILAVGHEIYNQDLVSLLLSGYSLELGVPISEILKLGLVPQSSTFSMTILSMHMAGRINAVSTIHASKAATIWPNYPMLPITNGIHLSTWDKVLDLKNHQARKVELLQLIATKTGITWDPKTLLLGWARRFVEYKRPLAILDEVDKFVAIAQNSQFPVRIVFAGNPHEHDVVGQKLVSMLQELIKTKLAGLAVYLPNYDMVMAEKLVAGCDVWLNTPIVGFEACGTSGMKAALNGALPCSTLDGWMAEVDVPKIGWILDSDHLSDNIQDVLAQSIVPMYYQKPQEWQEMMQNARELVQKRFSTARMLQEYTQKLYN